MYFKYKTFAFEQSPRQLHGLNSGARFPNHYTSARAKLEKVLPIAARDIHRFINIIHNW